MGAGTYLAGSVLLAFGVAAAVFVSVLIVRRRLDHLPTAPRVVAHGLIVTVALVAFHQLPLMLGVLNRASALVTAALVAALVAFLLRARAASEPRDAAVPVAESEQVSWALAWIAGVAVAGGALAYVLSLSTTPVQHVDYMEFHVPAVAGWIDSGSLWPILQFEPLKWSGYYPNTGNVLMLAATLPWNSDFLLRLLPLPWLALTVAAVYALALEWGAPRASALLAGLAVVSAPVILLFSLGAAMPDVVLFTGFTAGLLFLRRHQRSGRRSDLVLAGLGLGLALGTKWYGVPAAGLCGLVWVFSRLVARERISSVMRDAVLLTGVSLLTGGIWLLRNLVAAGNPFQPVGVADDPVRDELGSSIADYRSEPSTLVDIAQDIVELSVRPVGLLLLLSVAVGGAVAIRRREWSVLAGAVLASLIALAYVVTPYTAQGPVGDPNFAWVNARYAMPALLIGAAMIAWLMRRGGRWRWVAETILVVAILDAVAQSLRGRYADIDLVAIAAGVLFAGAGGLIAWRLRGRGVTFTRLGARSVVAVVASGLLIAGYAMQRAFLDDRYERLDPAFGWIAEHAGDGQRVAMTGQWKPSDYHPILPLFGPRLGNHVRFIGARRRDTIVQHRLRGPFVDELRRERIDLLLTTVDAEQQIRWARSEGYVPVTRSPRLLLLRHDLRGPR